MTIWGFLIIFIWIELIIYVIVKQILNARSEREKEERRKQQETEERQRLDTLQKSIQTRAKEQNHFYSASESKPLYNSSKVKNAVEKSIPPHEEKKDKTHDTPIVAQQNIYDTDISSTEEKKSYKESIGTTNNISSKYYHRGSGPSYSGPGTLLHSSQLNQKQAIEKSIQRHEEIKKKVSNRPVRIHYNDFVVRSNIFHCLHKDHNIRDIEAVIEVFTKSGDTMDVTVSAGYCENCNLYFIMESVFKKVMAIGNPLCLVVEYNKYASKNHYYENRLDELSPQSRLNMCGYNVSQQNGLTALERQKILAGMVDNGIATKQEILSYLQYFIHMRESREQYKNAIRKWEEDIVFISNYRIGSYGAKRVGSIKIAK